MTVNKRKTLYNLNVFIYAYICARKQVGLPGRPVLNDDGPISPWRAKTANKGSHASNARYRKSL